MVCLLFCSFLRFFMLSFAFFLSLFFSFYLFLFSLRIYFSSIFLFFSIFLFLLVHLSSLSNCTFRFFSLSLSVSPVFLSNSLFSFYSCISPFLLDSLSLLLFPYTLSKLRDCKLALLELPFPPSVLGRCWK